MNASFNAVQGLETEYACYRGQRQGGENTYRAGERLKNLNGYLLAVEYLADIAAVSDHEEHAAERRADIGEHERVRHRAHYVAPDGESGFQQLTRREIGRFSFISHSDEAIDIATSITAPTAPTIIIAKIIALRSIGLSLRRL